MSETFGLDSDPYDEYGFYVGSTDKRGHSDQVNVKIPQGQTGHLWTIVRAYPEYRSVQDFVRDAIVHLMHKRNEQLQDSTIDDRITLDIIQSRTRVLREAMAEKRDAVNNTLDALKEAYLAQDWLSLERVMIEAEQTVVLLPDPYQSQLRDGIETYRMELRRHT